jgi:hypothetical protein
LYCAIKKDAFVVLQPPSEDPKPLNAEDEADAAVITQMQEVLGEFFATALMGDAVWAKDILSATV